MPKYDLCTCLWPKNKDNTKIGFVDVVQFSGMASILRGVDPKDIAFNVIELKRKSLYAYSSIQFSPFSGVRVWWK